MKCENPKISRHEVPTLDRWESESLEIRVSKHECIKYLFFPEKDGNYERKFIVEEWAVLRASAVIIWSDIVLKMSVFIEGGQSDAHLMLLWLASDNSTLEIHGIGKTASGLDSVKLRVDQTNILLGTHAKVRGMPVLEVGTDSIEWGHSCRIHRISGEALFYLESHGLDTDSAEAMLLEGEVSRHVAIMEEGSQQVREEILAKLKY